MCTWLLTSGCATAAPPEACPTPSAHRPRREAIPVWPGSYPPDALGVGSGVLYGLLGRVTGVAGIALVAGFLKLENHVSR